MFIYEGTFVLQTTVSEHPVSMRACMISSLAEIPPGFRVNIRIQALPPRGISPNFSPNPAIEITRLIKRSKRKIAKLRQRRNELFPHNPFQYTYTLASYKANIIILEKHLRALRHFIA